MGVIPTRMFPLGVGHGKETRGSVLFQRTDTATTGLIVDNLFSAIPTTFTITAWAKAVESPTYGGIFKLGWCSTAQGGGGAGIGFGFGTNSFSAASPGSNAVILAEAYAWNSFGSAGTITQWRHYAVTKSGNTITVYANGSRIAQKSQSSISTGACPFSIGGGHTLLSIPSHLASASRLFYGNITRVAMWTSALTAAQVATDYADGGNDPSVASGLVHFWPMSTDANFLTDSVGGATLTQTVNATFSMETPFA